ncbi:nuclear transport factor 2 family protein [Rosenbergiella epipactidis]|uniref:nuclear transport factor 2 family protein n=1 Tax=Rosenbergiella epipactidis TaxID=1544694 RepID=UPI001F4E1BB4|nr:DUF4440 domain-containing protein [Rosenbergiella epipactidis]
MLIDELRRLECSLHGAMRYDREWLEQLLHPQFLEITRSGLTVNRSQTITSLLSEKTTRSIFSRDFMLTELGRCSAILHYRTSYADNSHQALRSSHWLLSAEKQWMLIFHQGTPAADVL